MNNSPRQQKIWPAPRKDHGGQLARGKRKGLRPVTTKRPMLVTIKSARARGIWSLLRHESAINAAIDRTAKRFQVRIHRRQNVGNHLHLLVQAARREDFQNFLRVVTQAVVFLVTGARKGNPVGRFWDSLAWSRVVEWGRDWWSAKRYLEKNRIEAAGVPRALVDAWFEKAPKPK